MKKPKALSFRVLLPVFCAALLMFMPFVAFGFDIIFYNISATGEYWIEGEGWHSYVPSIPAKIVAVVSFVFGLGLLFLYAPKLESKKKK